MHLCVCAIVLSIDHRKNSSRWFQENNSTHVQIRWYSAASAAALVVLLTCVLAYFQGRLRYFFSVCREVQKSCRTVSRDCCCLSRYHQKTVRTEVVTYSYSGRVNKRPFLAMVVRMRGLLQGHAVAFILCGLASVSAHVALTFPPARKYDFDFLDTFR